MPTYVKTDYVPEDVKHYITVGVEYEIIRDSFKECHDIKDDDGEIIPIRYTNCAYLDGADWTVINRP